MQHLTYVDVAKPGNQPLIDQERLEGRLPRGHSNRKTTRAKFLAQRFNAEAPGEPVGGHLARGAEIHHAETAGIGVNDTSAIIEHEHDVIMETAGTACRLAVHLAEASRLAALMDHGETARHAQMHDQAFAPAQRHNQIFGATADCFDTLPGQTIGEAFWQREPQIGAI